MTCSCVLTTKRGGGVNREVDPPGIKGIRVGKSMEDGEVQDGDSDEPTAFGRQPTEELPSSAALREKSASEPEERAGHPSARDPGHGYRKGPGDLREVNYNIQARIPVRLLGLGRDLILLSLPSESQTDLSQFR